MTPFEEEQMDALKRQVERLTEHAENLGTALLESRAEVERLTIERDEARKDGTRLLNEVERLREQREGLLSVEFENRKEIERLRKFVEEQTELGRQ